MNLRKINRIIHRDLGYFFTGMIIIYALSGIALNHKHDWNPNYIISTNTFEFYLQPDDSLSSIKIINSIINESRINEIYRKHYLPDSNSLKIFLSGGSTISFNTKTNLVLVEEIKERPFFSSVNFLHYNPGKIWKYFSDVFAICLILITLSGLIIPKGNNGFIWRGFIIMSIGITVPVIIYFLY